ncbi:MAG: gliding motility-associated C-terminal domain-containing protein [Flavobacteriales bacterium]|nr:gliding motility-associated C-terminal domain-containing protein [Flavobacteriales bacterium]
MNNGNGLDSAGMNDVSGISTAGLVRYLRSLLPTLIVLVSWHASIAQNTGDCFSAIPVCQGVYNEANSPPGEGDLPDEIDSGLSCLGGGEVDGQWYTFTVQNSGQFCFSIIPNNIGNDYDWAVFNLTNADCADIATNASLEVACNFSGLPGVTGANGLTGGQNEPCISVQTGQTYVLYVSNWSQSPFGYSLNTQVPGSTASIFDGTPPSLSSTVDVQCPRTEIAFAFSEQVLCTSVQPTDITLSGPGSTYTITGITSADCLAGGEQSNNFVATVSPALVGTGPFTLTMSGVVIDLCGNPSQVGTSIAFSLPPELILDVTATATGCGGSATGSVTGMTTNAQGFSIFRLNGASPQTNNGTYTGLTAGTYTVSVLDAAGCSATGQATVIVESEMTSTIATTNVVCFGQSDGTAIVSTTGIGVNWNYTWLDQAQNVIRSTMESIGDTLITGPGNFSVVIAESAPGVNCTDTLIFTITEPTLLAWTSTPQDTTICLTGQAVVSASANGGTLPVQLTWTPTLIGTGPHVLSPTSSVNYSIVATDANGCNLAPFPFSITVLDPISATLFTPTEICNGIPFTVDMDNTSGGDGDFHFLWNNGAPDVPLITDSLIMDATLCVTVSDGCETPTETLCNLITVLQTPPFEVTADTTFGCAPFLVNFTFLDTTNGAEIDWSFGDGVITADGGDLISHLYAIGGNYSVNTTVLWPNGCVTDTTLFGMVDVISVPVADFTWEPVPLTIFEPTGLFQEGATPNEVSYEWDFFDFGTWNGPDTLITFPNDQGRFYPVQLRVENELGCADSILINVEVEDEFLVYAPNAFSPDGDGINELFLIEGNDVDPKEFDLRIFDRWGHAVFLTTDRNIGWDGSGLPQGVYNYRLKLRSKRTLHKRIIMGHVTLVR